MFTAEGPQCHLTQTLVLLFTSQLPALRNFHALLCMFVRLGDFIAGKELLKLAETTERSWFVE